MAILQEVVTPKGMTANTSTPENKLIQHKIPSNILIILLDITPPKPQPVGIKSEYVLEV